MRLYCYFGSILTNSYRNSIFHINIRKSVVAFLTFFKLLTSSRHHVYTKLVLSSDSSPDFKHHPLSRDRCCPHRPMAPPSRYKGGQVLRCWGKTLSGVGRISRLFTSSGHSLSGKPSSAHRLDNALFVCPFSASPSRTTIRHDGIVLDITVLVTRFFATSAVCRPPPSVPEAVVAGERWGRPKRSLLGCCVFTIQWNGCRSNLFAESRGKSTSPVSCCVIVSDDGEAWMGRDKSDSLLDVIPVGRAETVDRSARIISKCSSGSDAI